MSRIVSLLFAPPLPPLRLTPGGEATLGRSPTCDLTLGSAQASRHHAVVRHDAEGVWLVDLGSTNGTFVNGERQSGPCRLAAGDRIRIGELEITYGELDDLDAGTGDGELTQLADPTLTQTSTLRVLEGDLARIPLFAVLQVLELGGQAGRLRVLGPGGPMSVWLEHGRLVHGQTEKEEGLEAVLRVVAAKEGHFAFCPDARPPARSLDASVTEILLETSRREDEAGA